MKVSELSGAALDWAVAIAEGFKPEQLYVCGWSNSIYTRTFDEDGNPYGYMTGPDRLYSKKWEAGGPIIERERISVVCDEGDTEWQAVTNAASGSMFGPGLCGDFWNNGPTPLIAAMRCYVASKLGDDIEIPKELMQ